MHPDTVIAGCGRSASFAPSTMRLEHPPAAKKPASGRAPLSSLSHHPSTEHRNHRSVSNFHLSSQLLSICRRARCLVRPWPLAWRGGAVARLTLWVFLPGSQSHSSLPVLLLPRTFWPAHFHFNPRRPRPIPRPIHARCSSIHAQTLQVSSTTPAAPTSKVAKQAPVPSVS